jgi:ABC-2 type transport system ATP-binding protein
LIGYSGAGKTTLIRMLLGLLPPTRGRAGLLGCDCEALTPEVRARIGYLAEGHFIWGWMRACDAARMQRETFPRWDQHLFDSMPKFFGVDPQSRVRQVSRGQRAGVSLAMTLATDPELLVLDDPSMGLDPVARRSLVEGLLAFARRSDRAILICTHLLDDVERLPTGSRSSATANCWWIPTSATSAIVWKVGRSTLSLARHRRRRFEA